MKTFHCFRNAGLIFILILALSTTLSAQTPQYYNYNNVGASSNTFPFGQAAGKAVQWLFLAGDFNQPAPLPPGNQITKVWYFITTGGTRTFTDLAILMAQDTIVTLTSGTFYSGTMDTVYHRASVTLTGPTNGWMEITLDTPYPYDPTKSLIVMTGQCASSGSGIYVRQNALANIRRDWSVGGCPFVPSTGDGSTLNFGMDVEPISTQVTNRTLLFPTPGVNTNYVVIPHQSSMVGFGNNVTIEGWVKIGGSTTPNTVLNKGGSSFDYQLGINATTANPFFRAQTTIVLGSAINIPVGVWTHLAVVSNGTSVTFYVNGVSAQTVPTPATLGASTNEMRIGRGGSDPSSGRLDEIRLWGVARTPAEIASNICVKYIPLSTPGLKAVWHLDSNFVDSVSGYNGSALGNVGFDTMTFCPIVTKIKGKDINLPNSYKLGQNYPNPFNPTTNIEFSIPKSGYVELKVYNILGKEVATLVSDPYQAGSYIVSFNASSLSSGIYFYKITVNDFVEIKKMMLIK